MSHTSGTCDLEAGDIGARQYELIDGCIIGNRIIIMILIIKRTTLMDFSNFRESLHIEICESIFYYTMYSKRNAASTIQY